MFPAPERKLSVDEIAALPAGFTSQIDIAKLRLIDRHHNPFAVGKILARPDAIYWKNCPPDFSRLTLSAQSLLMHELCHIWQYKTGRLTALSYLLDPRHWEYQYTVKPNAKFDDYPIEQQADLLQDWFLMNNGAPAMRFSADSSKPTLDWINQTVPFNPPLTIERII